MNYFQFMFETNVAGLYGVMLASGVLAGFVLACFLLYKKKIIFEYILYSVMINTAMMFICGQLYTRMIHGFKEDSLFVSFSSMGAAIGIILGTIIFSLILYKERKRITSAYSIAVPLMYAISKLGCFFGGCCNGIRYDGLFAVSYHNKHINDGPFLPIQLMESVTFFLIFFICLVVYFSKRSDIVAAFTAILSSAGKFVLDFLREEHIGKILSVNQLFCIIVAVTAVFFLLLQLKGQKRQMLDSETQKV